MRSKILLIVLMLTPFLVVGQSRSDLKGPEYKNYKVWKAEKKDKPVYTLSSTDKLQGPDAKNKRLFRKEQKAEARVVADKNRAKRKGPWAKNYKPWKND